MIKNYILILAITFSLSSCFLDREERIRGNGDISIDERNLTSFDGVDSYGSFDIYVQADSSYSVAIKADENLQQYIETDISSGRLRVRTARGYSLRPSGPLEVYVSAPVFNRLHSSGSGNIRSRKAIVADDDLELGISGSGNIELDVTAPSVSVDISGSGNVVLNGTTNSFRGSIAGSGDIRAGGLKSKEARITIAGSGNGIIHADKDLDVEIAGSGDVRYTGDAKVRSHIAGSGSVSQTSD